MTQQKITASAELNEPWQPGLVRLDGVRVLLVDDEQDTRNLLTVI
jgi:hypoxanthine phosphoribosyltransferase